MLGDHGIYLKGPYFYDPMVKVPLVISWKGHIKEGVRRKALTELLDLAPTLLDLANLKGPYFYDPMVKVPLVISWKGHIKEGVRRKALTELLDLAPTLLDLANLPIYEGMQGLSMKNLLLNQTAKDQLHLSAFSEYSNANQGELYNLIEDPEEFQNLYEKEEMREVRIRMLEEMVNCLAYTIDPLPKREAIC